MSAILGFGGIIYESVIADDHSVIYRPTDTSLNISNYQPIYAMRWVEPTEIAPAARIASQPVIFPDLAGTHPAVPQFPAPPPSTLLPPKTVELIEQQPDLPGADTAVPEPAYNLVVLLILVVFCLRYFRVRSASAASSLRQV